MKKDVVYTAVFGNYDTVPSVNPEWKCDYICFTDNPEIVSAGWTVVLVDLNGELPADANRRYKMLPHKYLCNYERSMYLDGNISLVNDPAPLFDKYLVDGVIALPKHQYRCCAYEEADICIGVGIVDKEQTKRQMEKYRSEGFPWEFGLTENGIILRKHNDVNVIELMNLWWEEYCTGVKRDQLSLPYLLWKNNFPVSFMSESARNNNKYFRIKVHNKMQRMSSVGRMVDHIWCNRHRNIFYSVVHQVIHRLGRFQILRKIAR